MSTPTIRILIVDDTALYRKVLTDAFAQIPEATVAGAVASGPAALARLATDPVDLVLLDVFMPEMNGPEVLARLRRDHPRTAVVMISGATGPDAAITIDALADGALDFIPKPQAASFAEGMSRLRSQLQQVVRIVRIRKFAVAPGTARPAPAATAAPAPLPKRKNTSVIRPEILLIGVSTGGPRALHELLPRLPADFRLPVVIVQHMPPLFTRSLADQLTKTCPLPVVEASDAEPVTPGRILLAPGGRHLELVRDPAGPLRTQLTDTPPVNSCRPAVDVLFQSAARAELRGALSLILTGMGEDGANGVAALKASVPTWSIVQDEATCVIYGMPQAVVRRNLEDEILPLPSIAPRLVELTRLLP